MDERTTNEITLTIAALTEATENDLIAFERRGCGSAAPTLDEVLRSPDSFLVRSAAGTTYTIIRSYDRMSVTLYPARYYGSSLGLPGGWA